MIAGGDIYLHIWFDPLVSNLHIFFSVDDTVQLNGYNAQAFGYIIKPPGPFPDLMRSLTPKNSPSLFAMNVFDGWGSSAYIQQQPECFPEDRLELLLEILLS